MQAFIGNGFAVRGLSCVRTLLALGAAMMLGCGSPTNERAAAEPNLVTGATMLPGENCLRCHSPGSAYPDAPVWTAAGTVFDRADGSRGVAGAIITLTDPSGRVVRLTTNEVGNFFTSEPLERGFRAAIEYDGRRADMPIGVPAGACNACHAYPNPSGGAKGRIRLPE